MARLGLALALLLAPTLAWADPFSLLATAIVGATGATGFAALAIYAGAGLLRTNAAKRKAKKAKAAQVAAYNASLQDRTAQFASAEATERYVYGSPAPIGGNVLANFVSGGKDEFRHLVIYLASHESQACDGIFVDGVNIGSLDAGGWVTGGEFFESTRSAFNDSFTGLNFALSHVPVAETVQVFVLIDGDSYLIPHSLVGSVVSVSAPYDGSMQKRVSYDSVIANPRLRVVMHLSPGGVDTADAGLMAAVPGKWTAAHKASNTTYAVITVDLRLPRFQGGPPAFTFKLRGKKVFDPRTSATAYSANPVLCSMDYLRSRHGGGVSLLQMDASWIAAANSSDAGAYPAPPALPALPYSEWLLRTGGSPELFRCDAVFTLDQGRDSILANFESSFSGEISESAGMWRVRAGVWAAPVITLGDQDVFGLVEQLQGGFPLEGRFNGARGQYLNASGLGVTQDAKPYSNAAFLAADGEPRIDDVPLGFIGSEQRAQHAMRIRVERSRGGQTLKVPASPKSWPLQPGDRITFSYSPFGIVARTFRVVAWSQALGNSPMIEIERDEVGVWDLADATTPYAQPTSNFPSAFIVPALTSLAAQSGDDYLIYSDDGGVITGVRLTWLPTDNAYVAQGGKVEIQSRSVLDASGNWQPQNSVDGSVTLATIYGLQENLHYQIRARFLNERGIPGAWSQITHRVVGKTLPPPNVSSFQLSLTTEGVRASWDIFSGDYGDTWLRKGTSWATATPAGAGEIRRNGTSYLLGWLPAGLQSYVAKHRDRRGVESALASNASITISPPAAPVFIRVEPFDNSLSLQWTDCKTSQPILAYEYYFSEVAQSFSQAVYFGKKGSDSLYDIITSQKAGLRRFWIVAVDLAGNRSTPSFLDVTFSLPKDFQLLNDFPATFAGSGSVNTIVDSGRVFLLKQPGLMIDHYSRYGWTNAAQKIAANKLRFFEPGSTTAEYSEEYDCGTLIAASSISVSLSTAVLYGSATVSIDIGYKDTIEASYTTISNSPNIVAQNFRYIKITVRAASPAADAQVQINSMSTRINIQEITESFALTLSAADPLPGTYHVCQKSFTDIKAATANILQGGSMVRVQPLIDDAGAIKRVAWVGFDAAGNRASGQITGLISGV